MNEMVFKGLLIYVFPALLIWGGYVARRKQLENRSLVIQKQELEAGLTEPASLHPVIDPVLCVGCKACVDACPEKNVLGMIRGKAELIAPTHCIGHGACKPACPLDAITLVFGTEKRGIDIPLVHPNFETNVPGIFIAGELGGMGLIRNAVTQGAQAVDSIRKLDGIGKGDLLDLVIIGAGPSGFSASLAAMQHKLRSVTVEQETLGGTVSHYPRGKVVMTAPVDLPIFGKTKFKETTKEALMEFWEGVERKTGVNINYMERVEAVTKKEGFIEVTTQQATYKTHAVLLSIGRRGTPRKLDVPGEELSKVVYRLIDPEQYKGKHVLVVGGGDSALEAATSIAEEPGTTVTLSYRSEAFSRAKQKNRDKVSKAEADGRLRTMMKSNAIAISEKHVEMEMAGEIETIANDAIIVCAGGILPTPFLKKIGVNVETKFGTE
jgi:thioredoxin reductase/Pyruvate/2-oxoacid:ferredoxin oxidoreductase delta subunit